MSRRAGIARVVPVACAALACVPAAAGANTNWTSYRPLHIAHQGGENEVPSATMYALERSLRLGADMLEVDVHRSADGELMVIHDATVDRTTNGTGRVYDMTRAELQALDAGYNTVPGEGIPGEERPAGDYVFRGVRTGERKPPPGYKRRDFRIPTLDEVMRAYPEVPVNIEIKGAADSDFDSFLRNAEALAAYLNDLGRTEGVMVASFNDAALQRFHELAPQIDLAPGIAGVAGYTAGGISPGDQYDAFQVPTEFNGIPVANQSFIERAHADGFAVHVWTINDEQQMRDLLGWGADGIMTAEPIRLERVLCASGLDRPPRPPGTNGKRCNRRASIACWVEATAAEHRGRRLVISLHRDDEFVGRCAGRAVAKLGRGLRAAGRFKFGDEPPSGGGPAQRTARIKLSQRARRAARQRERVALRARPYTGFAARARLSLD